jgi:hypothetical protein
MEKSPKLGGDGTTLVRHTAPGLRGFQDPLAPVTIARAFRSRLDFDQADAPERSEQVLGHFQAR